MIFNSLQTIRTLAATGLVAAVGTSASAQYRTIATLDQLDDDGTPATNLSGVVADGNTVYAILNSTVTDSPRIVSFDDANPGAGSTTVVSTAQYQAANPGDTFLSSGNFLGLVNGNLIYTDIATDALFASDVTTGTTVQQITNASLEAQVGGNARFGTITAEGPGDILFYDNFSDGIYTATGPAVVQELSDVQLTAIVGNDAVSGITAAGNSVIFGNNTNDAIYSIDLTTDTGGEILSTAQILAVTGQTAAGFSAFTTIGDDVFVYETSSDSILTFSLANPGGTLMTALSSSELLAGPAQTSSINALFDYNGQLGFFVDGAGSTVKGIYAVPEPTTAALLSLGALALLRRRRMA